MANPRLSAKNAAIPRLVTPITSPRWLNSGPPELPGLIAVSVCKKELALEVPALIADDPLRHRPLEPQRIADREDRISGIDIVIITQDDVARFQVGRQRQLDQGEVEKWIRATTISTSSIRRRVNPPGTFRYRIAETRVSPWITWALVIA